MATPTVYTPKRLITPHLLSGATLAIYTSPSGQAGTQLTTLKFTNVTTYEIAINAYVVEDGGSVVDARSLVRNYGLPSDGLPYDVLASSQFYLNAGDKVFADAASGSGVCVHLTGAELE